MPTEEQMKAKALFDARNAKIEGPEFAQSGAGGPERSAKSPELLHQPLAAPNTATNVETLQHLQSAGSSVASAEEVKKAIDEAVDRRSGLVLDTKEALKHALEEGKPYGTPGGADQLMRALLDASEKGQSVNKEINV